MDISQTIVQGGIGVSALVFALYIFNRCMDCMTQMKELSSSVIKAIDEIKEHDGRIIEELRDIVSALPKNSGEGK